MSRNTVDQLPNIPETDVIEPIVQCGVLYLGSAPPSPGRRGLDSIQEPLAHRYPVDGTNTAQGIDAVLSIYENGIQLAFTRQPHVVIFFPISSLVYCASVRYSIIENDQTSAIDWRFITLDLLEQTQSKHPPIFSAVIHRTQILSGDECHCFITKTDDAALTLVRTISEVYAKLSSNFRLLRSPIFYQLDRYGRKISETTGIIYLSPATKDENQLAISSINREVLLDPSLDGYFYRTDAILIEKWQLWDDDDLTGCRPRPPASPLGQHQGLYHDDLTDEIQQYLHLVDDDDQNKDHSNSCSCSSSSSVEDNDRYYSEKSKSKSSKDQFSKPSSHSHTSSFDPTIPLTHSEIKKPPIIIEKVLPNPIRPKKPKYMPEPMPPPLISPPPIDTFDGYQINEHGEKITKEGNRILYMDVIQPDLINDGFEPKPFNIPPKKKHRKRPKNIPMIDLRSVENLLKEKHSSKKANQENFDNEQFSTKDMLEIVEGYFEDYKGRKLNLNSDDAQAMIEHFEITHKPKKERRQSRDSFKKKSHHYHHTHSTLTSGPSINYVERPKIRSPSRHSSNDLDQQTIPSIFNNEYTSDINETFQPPATAATDYENSQLSTDTNTVTIATTEEAVLDFMSPFRYMQSSINPSLLREYRNAFSGMQ